ncbi:Uncharacterised protein [Neisseria zoodegmatis]|uniref:Uncharacterized protein n=1 Tax=Neisseria zoodegmatis TaxID=326523 RepID=A0A378WGE5_9NEIS|nr:hypothetical protein [Neisseria zoodegmatis]SUA35624.1 Uncharacterised protein [Neisseria zoodegmatis]
MKTATLPIETETAALQSVHLIVNGNIHRPDLCAPAAMPTGGIQISEALLPQIRTVATLIAAMRHDFTGRSPDVFTEEADWFAARIVVLGVRRFHLDITLLPMLKLANQRARAFAASRHLPFIPTEIRMSLHAGRPVNLLIAETELNIEECGNMVANSMALKKQLVNF